MKNIDHLFITKEDFFCNAQKSDSFQKVTKEIQEEEGNKLIDNIILKHNRTWSILGHQVVGAEIF